MPPRLGNATYRRKSMTRIETDPERMVKIKRTKEADTERRRAAPLPIIGKRK